MKKTGMNIVIPGYNKNLEQYVQVWQNNGKHFGYPDCCIKSFIDRGSIIINSQFKDIPNYSSEQTKVSNNTGFIPCQSCAGRIVKGEIKLEDLIRDRKNTAPFPDER